MNDRTSILDRIARNWAAYDIGHRMYWCEAHGVSVFAARRDELPAVTSPNCL